MLHSKSKSFVAAGKSSRPELVNSGVSLMKG